MTSISIDLSKKTDPLLANCLKTVKSVAEDLDIDFFVGEDRVKSFLLTIEAIGTSGSDHDNYANSLDNPAKSPAILGLRMIFLASKSCF